MTAVSKIRCSLACGTACAVMISAAFPFRSDKMLFFPSFILSACSEQTDEEEVEYGFALFDLLKRLFC